MASAIRSAVMVYTGGSSEYTVQYVSGGYVMDDVSMRLSCRGGEAGGVTGSPPGEHVGMCLLGMAVGVPRDDVLSKRCGGGVVEREGMGNALLATAAAMVADDTGYFAVQVNNVGRMERRINGTDAEDGRMRGTRAC